MEDQRAFEVWCEYQEQEYGPKWHERFECNCGSEKSHKERTNEEICSDIAKQMEMMTLSINESMAESLREKLKKSNNHIQPQPLSQFAPVPTCAYYINPCSYCGCKQDIDICKDCHFYEEEHDMGATIPWCTKFHQIIDIKPKDCTFYITRNKVNSLVEKFLEDQDEKA